MLSSIPWLLLVSLADSPSQPLPVAPVAPVAPAEPLASVRVTTLLRSDDLTHGAFDVVGHVGLSAHTPDLAPGLRLEAELSLLVMEAPPATTPVLGMALVDNASFLRLRYRPPAWGADEGGEFTVLPFHSDRLVLGFGYPLADVVGPLKGYGPETGLSLQVHRTGWSAWAAVKSGMIFNEQIHEGERAFTELLGGAVDVLGRLRLEVQGGHADQGVNPEPQVLGKPVATLAGAARAMFHQGLAIGPPTDDRRYRRDPAVWEDLLRPEVYDDGLSLAVSLEGLVLYAQGLADATKVGSIVSETEHGAAFEARVKWQAARAYVRLQTRSLALIQADVLGFPPYSAVSTSGSTLTSESSAQVAVDYAFRSLGLTPGLGFDLTSPATFTAAPGSRPFPSLTVVVNDANAFEVEPNTDKARMSYRLRATLRWDKAWLSVLAEGVVTHDPNRTTFLDNSQGVSTPTFDNPTSYGFTTMIQARF
jgi:hypothetical protein